MRPSTKMSDPLLANGLLTIAWCLAVSSGALGAEERLRELRLPSLLVESEVKPDLGFEAPPTTYPLEKVEQLPYHGAWHGFVNTTTGGLVFRVVDMRLPGRMPLEWSRVYDSKMSSALPPAPPGRDSEQRSTQDLGRNWIPAYASYLIKEGYGYQLITEDGYIVLWEDQGDGTLLLKDGVPSPHLRMEQIDIDTVVETRMDGTRRTYTSGLGYTYALTKIEDRSGNSIDITYDALGFMERVENSDGAYFDIHRDGNSSGIVYRISSVTAHTGPSDPGRTVLYDYNSGAILNQVTDVIQSQLSPQVHWTYGYDSEDKLIWAKDPTDDEFLTASYDVNFRTRTVEANDGHWTFTYDSQNSETRALDPLGNIWIYGYDANGMTRTIEEPTGGVHTLNVDALRNPVGYTDPEGATTSWTYDSLHRPLAVSAPGVSVVTYTYDAQEDWVNSITSATGGVTQFIRDAQGRILEEHSPDGAIWKATYDPANGDQLTLTFPKGNEPGASGFEWTLTRGSSGELVAATDPTGRQFQFAYASIGELASITRPQLDGNGNPVDAVWTYTTDDLGRTTGISDPLGNLWQREYDPAGRLVSQTAPDGVVLNYDYDNRHRLTSVQLTDGVVNAEVLYTYDSASRLATRTLPTGAVWTYAYDGSSRLTQIVGPLGREWEFERDLAGKVEQAMYPGGQTVVQLFDSEERLIERSLPGGRVDRLGYDPITGRLAFMEVDRSSQGDVFRVDWTYDVMERTSSLTTTYTDSGSSELVAVGYTYDLHGNRETATLPGEVASYSYDEIDRLLGITATSGDDWVLAYDPYSGHRVSASSPAQSFDWQYDLAGRLTREDWAWDSGSAEFTFGYDSRSRMTLFGEQLSGYTETYTFDGRGLLQQATRLDPEAGLATTGFEYDVMGELVGRTDSFASGAVVESVFQRDLAGRLIYASSGGKERHYYWSDNPPVTDAAFSVARIPVDVAKPVVEQYYGFDGRLIRLDSFDRVDSESTTMAEYVWSPLAEDLSMGGFERSGEEVYPFTLVAGGGGYLGVADPSFSVVFSNRVQELDRAAVRNAPLFGGEAVSPLGPFSLGTWSGASGSRRPGVQSLAGFATSRDGALRNVDLLRSLEERATGRLSTADLFNAPQRDVVDDWTNHPLVDGMQRPDRWPLVDMFSSTTSAYSPDAAAGVSPTDSTNPWYMPPQSESQPCYCDDPDFVEPTPTGGGQPFYWPYCCWGESANPGAGTGPPGDGEGGWDPPVVDPPGCQPGTFAVSVQPSENHPILSEGGVSLQNGAFVHHVTDLSVFAPRGSLAFTRSYRSQNPRTSTLGRRWTHNWNEFVDLGSAPLQTHECSSNLRNGAWVRPDGSVVSFIYDIADEGVAFSSADASYAFRMQGDTFRIRERDTGTVRSYQQVGSVFRLTSIDENGVVTELHYSSGELSSVTRGAASLTLFYENDMLSHVVNGNDIADRVDYLYLGSDLTEVTYSDSTMLQHDGILWSPSVRYSYEESGEVGGPHYWPSLLSTIEHLQAESDQDVPQWVRRLSNGYSEGQVVTVPEQLPVYSPPKVQTQCFGTGPCDTLQDADLQYSYSSGPSVVATVYDRRIPRHDEYHFDKSELIKLIESTGGERRTTRHFSSEHGRRERTIHPDGTCVEVTWGGIPGGPLVPVVERQRSAENCIAGGYPPADTDLVTVMTYESYLGKLKTVTGPEAFPDGLVPASFDPDDEAYRPYTKRYTYDFEEQVTTEMSASCGLWVLDCPAAGLGDINGDPEDDANAFGNPIRIEVFDEGDPADPNDGHALVTLMSYDSWGRLLRTTTPDGVRRQNSYYTDPTGQSWDFRLGDAYSSAFANEGRLAAVSVESNDGLQAIVARRVAWDKRGFRTAEENNIGVVKEWGRAPGGLVMTESICRLDNNEPNCQAVLSPDEQLLRTRYYEYDLRGRPLVVREEGLDPSGQLEVLSEEHRGYDDAGNVATITADPAGKALLSRFYYDESNRLVKSVSPEGRVSCIEYDLFGQETRTWAAELDNEATSCDPPQYPDPITRTYYDVVGRVIMTKDPEGARVYRWYDGLGRLAFVSDGRPPDAVDWVLGEGAAGPPSPDTEGIWYEETAFDEASRPSRSRFFGTHDPDSTESGFLKVTWQQYDSMGRPTVSTSAVAPTSYVSTGLEGADAPIPPTGAGAPPMSQTSFSYDGFGRLQFQSDPKGRIVETTYDAFGRPEYTYAPGPTSPNRDRRKVEYDPSTGRITQVLTTSVPCHKS